MADTTSTSWTDTLSNLLHTAVDTASTLAVKQADAKAASTLAAQQSATNLATAVTTANVAANAQLQSAAVNANAQSSTTMKIALIGGGVLLVLGLGFLVFRKK